MSEMVDRVAKALAFLEEWIDPEMVARAAIEAMREPTDGMMNAALPDDAFWNEVGVEGVWKGMIDEALK